MTDPSGRDHWYQHRGTNSEIISDLSTTFWHDYEASSIAQYTADQLISLKPSRTVVNPQFAYSTRHDSRLFFRNFHLELRGLLSWLSVFFDPNPTADECDFCLFFFRRMLNAVLTSMILNAVLLLGVQFYFLPFTTLSTFAIPMLSHCIAWLVLTGACLCFIVVYCCAPHWLVHVFEPSRVVLIDAKSVDAGSSIVKAWMEVGRAIIYTRLFTIVMRVARYGTLISPTDDVVPLCLEMLDLQGASNDVFTYLLLRIGLDVSETFLFSFLPFPAPWTAVLCFTELLSQMLRITTCSNYIGPSFNWLPASLSISLFLLFLFMSVTPALLVERSVRETFRGQQRQSTLVKEKKEIVRLLVSEVKVPVIELQHTISSIMKRRGINDDDLRSVMNGQVGANYSRTGANAASSLEVMRNLRGSVEGALAISDNLLLQLRVLEGKYRFTVRDLVSPMEKVYCALGVRYLEYHTSTADDNAMAGDGAAVFNRLNVPAYSIGWELIRTTSSVTDAHEESIGDCKTIHVEIHAPLTIVQTDKFYVGAILRELLSIRIWGLLQKERRCNLRHHSDHDFSDQLDAEVESIVVRLKVRCDEKTRESKYMDISVDHRLRVNGDHLKYWMPQDILRGHHMSAKWLVLRRLVESAVVDDLKVEGWVEKDAPHDGPTGRAIIFNWSVTIPCTSVEPLIQRHVSSVSGQPDKYDRADILIFSESRTTTRSMNIVIQQCAHVNGYDETFDTVCTSVTLNDVMRSVDTVSSLADLRTRLRTIAAYRQRVSNIDLKDLLARKYVIVFSDSVQCCKMLRQSPYKYKGMLILFSNNLTYLSDEDTQSADLVMPMLCDRSDVKRLSEILRVYTSTVRDGSKNPASAAMSKDVESPNGIIADGKETSDSKADSGDATDIDHRTGSILTLSELVNIRSLAVDESYVKWRLLNPSGSALHFTNIFAVSLLFSILMNFIHAAVSPAAFSSAANVSVAAVLYLMNGILYRFVLQPLKLPFHAYWNGVHIVINVFKLFTTYNYVIEAVSEELSKPRQLLSFFMSMFSIWVPYIIFIPPPYYIAVNFIHFMWKAASACVAFWYSFDMGLASISLWMYSGTTLQNIINCYFYEKAHRQEFCSLHERLRSLSFMDTAFQGTLPCLRSCLLDLLKQEQTIFRAIVERMLTLSGKQLMRNLQELKAYSSTVLNISVALPKLEFFDTSMREKLCRSTEVVLLRSEVFSVLKNLRVTYESTLEKLGLKLSASVSSVLVLVLLNRRLFLTMLMECCLRAIDAFQKHHSSLVGANLTNELHIVISSSDRTFVNDRSTGSDEKPFHQVRRLHVRIYCSGIRLEIKSPSMNYEPFNANLEMKTGGTDSAIRRSRGFGLMSSTFTKMVKDYKRFERLSDEGSDSDDNCLASRDGHKVWSQCDDGGGRSVELAEFTSFDFPYYLSAHSFFAFSMMNDSLSARALKTPPEACILRISDKMIRSEGTSALLQQMVRRAECSEEVSRATKRAKRVQMSITLYEKLKSRNLHRMMQFFTGWGVLWKRDARKYVRNFRYFGWECHHTAPVRLPSAELLSNADAILIDSSVENSQGEDCIADDQSKPKLGVVNLIVKARLSGFQGMIVVLVDDDDEYTQLRTQSRMSSLPCSAVDLVLHKPLTAESVNQMCSTHDAILKKRCLTQLQNFLH